MRIPDIAVNRKVTVMMIMVAIILFGILTVSRLGLELLPDMDYPVISIMTTYEGAAPEDIEDTVTRPIEQSIATVSGITNIRSQSLENYSMIMVEFEWGTNLDFAAQDLRDTIDQVYGRLPRDVERPIVYKFDIAMIPVITYAVSGVMDDYQLRRIIDEELSMRIEQLEGVASLQAMGGDEREIQIVVDRYKLSSHNISINEIPSMVMASNLNMPAGHIERRKDEFLLRTVGQYKSLQEIRETPLTLTDDGQVVYVEDVAEVRDAYRDRRYKLRANKRSTAYIMVSKEAGANTLTVSNRVKEEVARIHDDYGDQITFTEVMDMGRPIYLVTTGAAQNLLLGGILAILIMLLFLRNWRPTFAISIAIPVSVIATGIAMYLADFTLNIMTIGGLALGVGMLVDNAIVVIENIYRHQEMGKGRVAAAKDGASEVGMAITASTLTTIAVFLPMVFAGGLTGMLVRGLALTVAFSLFCSLFVALTIVPVIASLTFHTKSEKITPVQKSKLLFERVRKRYLKILDWVLHHRTATLVVVAVVSFASLGLLTVIGTEFMPEGDMPFVILNLEMPLGTTLEETDFLVQQVEDIFLDTPGVTDVMAIIGPMEEAMLDPTSPQDVNQAQIIGSLLEMRERPLTREQIREHIRERIPEVEEADLIFLGTDQMMGEADHPIVIKIFGRDLDILREASLEIEERIAGIEHITNITHTLGEAKDEAHIVIDKVKAFQYGLTTAQIANAVNTASIGTFSGIYRAEGEEVDIRVRFDEKYRQFEEDILELSIASPMGFPIPLNQIAHIEYVEGPVTIHREDQTRVVEVTADIVETRDIGGKVSEVQEAISDIIDALPTGYFVEFGGAYEDMLEAFETLIFALILAIVLVYLVMASQFESLKQPFVVMFTIPLAAVGVMLALFISGTTLSVASFVGGIILAGIVVNNGIVLVDHINQLRRGGIEKHQAIMQAGSDRVRPVLITAITTMMGMLPMALSRYEGSNIKVPLSLTVIGGLITATFFTLFVIPVIYSLIEKIKYNNDEAK